MLVEMCHAFPSDVLLDGGFVYMALNDVLLEVNLNDDPFSGRILSGTLTFQAVAIFVAG